MPLSDEVRIYGVMSYDVDTIWPEVTPFLERAIETACGRFSLESTKKAIEAQREQLWVGYDSDGLCVCFVTTIIDYPCKRSLLIKFLGGRRYEAWIEFIDLLRGFAREHKCSLMEIYGRPGWEKILKRFRYEKEAVSLVLNLDALT